MGESVRHIRSLWLLALAACAAGVPDPPSLVMPPPDPTLPAVAFPAGHRPFLSLRRFPPPLPYPAPALDWSPLQPRQASAIAIRLSQPPGPDLEDITASLAGRPVAITRSGAGWVGVGGLPLDSAGFLEVHLRFRRVGIADSLIRLVHVSPRTYPSTRISISAGAASDPDVDARIERESRQIRAALLDSAGQWLPAAPFGWPRPPVQTSPFGQRRVFNGSVSSRHLGLDLRGARGAAVVAPAAGRVVLAGNFYYQGNAVYLDHGLGLVTAYFHFSSTDVREGETVEAGQLLGRVGSTGRSTAPHLHWSAYVGGENIDPESLIGLTLAPPTPLESAGGGR